MYFCYHNLFKNQINSVFIDITIFKSSIYVRVCLLNICLDYDGSYQAIQIHMNKIIMDKNLHCVNLDPSCSKTVVMLTKTLCRQPNQNWVME